MNVKPEISADEALQRLIDGNERFLRGESLVAGLSRESMAEMARGSGRSRRSSGAATRGWRRS